MDPNESAHRPEDELQPAEPEGADAAEAASVEGSEASIAGQDEIDALLREVEQEVGASGLESGTTTAESDWKSADKPLDDADRAMMAAMEEARRTAFDTTGDESQEGPGAADLDLPEFAAESAGGEGQPISLLHDVQLHVKVELGRTYMFVEDVLRLGEGSVVELDKLAGDPVDVYVNDRLVARGEVLVLNDNFCVRVSEIMNGAEAKMAG